MMNIDYSAQQTAQAQLEPGERLLWWGKPDPKRGLLLTIPVVLFGIPWTAFSCGVILLGTLLTMSVGW